MYRSKNINAAFYVEFLNYFEVQLQFLTEQIKLKSQVYGSLGFRVGGSRVLEFWLTCPYSTPNT